MGIASHPAQGARSHVDRTTASRRAAASELPLILRADLTGPRIERSTWVWTIGPAYAGLFAWVPFLDRFGTLLASPTSLGWLAATAGLAAITCYFLLYYVPATLGWKAGQRASLVGASALGTTGSEWLIGVATGLAAILFYAVSLSMAVRLTLLGLVSCGLIESSALLPRNLGPLVVESPVFLLTVLFWIYITGMASLLRLTGVVVALMQVYTPVALLLIGATAALLSSGLMPFHELGGLVQRTQPLPLEPGLAGRQLLQMVLSYFAFSAVLAIDWGMAVQSRRDVRLGGWVAIILAGSYTPIMALLAVAGAIGRTAPEIVSGERAWLARPLTFHWAVYRGIGGMTGGLILLLFGLATLAPAVYSASTFGRRLSEHWPRIRRFYWTWLCAVVAFVLVAFSWADHVDVVFSLIGAVLAPATGAIVADGLRHMGQWRGLRMGLNPCGVIAWCSGLWVGLIPLLGDLFHWPVAQNVQPATLLAFFTSAAVYMLLAAIGLEPPLVALPDLEHDVTPEPAAEASNTVEAATTHS